MSYRYEVRLSGSGGQGLILAGVILAEAAVIYDNKNATQTQAYGPEARGGASKSEVIVSDEDIDYPKLTAVDLLLALTQESCDKYIHDLKDTGILITDSFFVPNIPAGKFKVYKLPIVETAREKVGKVMVANIVSLGAIVGISKIISREAIEKAVLARVPKGTEELNKKALAAGFEMAESAN
jgi:2-oxoglutarate ferredoxin oxidoreductase subunit gamma